MKRYEKSIFKNWNIHSSKYKSHSKKNTIVHCIYTRYLKKLCFSVKNREWSCKFLQQKYKMLSKIDHRINFTNFFQFELIDEQSNKSADNWNKIIQKFKTEIFNEFCEKFSILTRVWHLLVIFYFSINSFIHFQKLLILIDISPLYFLQFLLIVKREKKNVIE